MKTQGIPQLLFLILMLGCASIQAEPKKGSAATVAFGIVNAIYPKESRMVIDDYSFRYTTNTKFYSSSGKTSAGSKKLKPGTPIKFHAYEKSSQIILKDLKVISLREYKKHQTSLREPVRSTRPR